MNQILVLEDDENLRELLVDVLDGLDYQASGAECAEVALHLAEEIVFDLVISDIRMAGPTDGLGALEELKRKRPQLACIVMTGYADELAPLRALQIRVDDYLYKPFDVQDIVAAIGRVKKSAEQNRWYRRALGKLMGNTPDQQLADLQTTREECLKSFFVAVRSGALYAETALDAWDRLEGLEAGYMAGMRSPQSLNAAGAREAYRTWQAQLSQRAAKGAFVTAEQRSADKVDRATFKRFLERLKSGSITAEELALAVGLRRMPPDRLPQEHQDLKRRLWN
jgi:DNA-binding NarL/FixJ family response regulator